MQIMWFFSGISARLIGLMGLSAAGILALQASSLGTGNLPLLALVVVLALFCLVKSAQFLLPNSHSATLVRTAALMPRAAFILVSLAWVLVSAYVVLDFARSYGAWPNGPYASAINLAVMVLLTAYLFFFLWGAAYRASPALRHARRVAASGEPQVEYFAHGGNSPAAVQMHQPARRYENKLLLDNAPNPLRRRDVWDNFFGLLFLATMAGGFYAIRFGTTVQTAALDQLIDDNIMLVYAAVTAVFVAPMVLLAVLRAPVTHQLARMGILKRLVYILLFVPIIGAAAALVVPYDLAPYAWNLATENDSETLTYQVIERESGRYLDNCVRFEIVDAPGREVMNCGLDPEFVANLTPGARVAATGELSDYAHSWETVSIAP